MADTATAPAPTTAAAPTLKREKYTFQEDVWVDETPSNRVLVEKGTAFTAQLAEETVIDRTGVTPREVKTGRLYVASSDIAVLPGCLTSCIRTGRAMTAEQVREAAKREAAKKAARK